jgi:hypothetical protein
MSYGVHVSYLFGAFGKGNRVASGWPNTRSENQSECILDPMRTRLPHLLYQQMDVVSESRLPHHCHRSTGQKGTNGFFLRCFLLWAKKYFCGSPRFRQFYKLFCPYNFFFNISKKIQVPFQNFLKLTFDKPLRSRNVMVVWEKLFLMQLFFEYMLLFF